MNPSRLRVFESLQPILHSGLKDSKSRAILIIAVACLCGILSAFSASPGDLWADRTLKSLSLRDKIAQLILVRVPGKIFKPPQRGFPGNS